MNSKIVAVAVGTVVRAPEVVQVGDTKVAKLSIAANDSYKKDGEWIETPTFLDVEVWANSAEYASKLSSGDFVQCYGEIKQQNWKNKEGEKRSKLVLKSHSISIISRKKNKSEDNQDDSPVPSDSVDNDVPF